jgi:two-component system response regulator (stage 0 sporulation protein A)
VRLASKALPPSLLAETIANTYLLLGIPPHTQGSRFLRESILAVIKDRKIGHRVTKVLYPMVTKQFDTSPNRVDRAIRHAIETAWTRRKVENINLLIGQIIYDKYDKPTNAEFIAPPIADMLLFKESNTDPK